MNKLMIEEIKNYLGKRNMSQREFGKLVGVDTATVNRWLHGQTIGKQSVKIIEGIIKERY